MMQFTEERRKELLAEIDYNRKNCFLSSKTELLMKIAEAALKAEPIGRVDRGEVSDSNEYPDARVVCLHDQADWENFQDGFLLYSAPPVAALKLPDCWIRCSERLPEAEESVLAYWPHTGHVEDVIFAFDEEDPEQRYHVLYDGERMSTEPSHWVPFTAPAEEKK